jgi:hypothetical protein
MHIIALNRDGTMYKLDMAEFADRQEMKGKPVEEQYGKGIQIQLGVENSPNIVVKCGDYTEIADYLLRFHVLLKVREADNKIFYSCVQEFIKENSTLQFVKIVKSLNTEDYCGVWLFKLQKELLS